jgi:ligand-binding sensor domain-containing protein/serine phosphatase RsbU (regulator of sigma subunit)
MKSLSRPLLLIICFFFLLKGSAQELKFYHIGTKQGLSQVVVNCILKDKRGFMWFGTQDGLNRYDGYTMVVYRHDPDDRNSLSDNFINCLYEDTDGTIWIGTSVGGLNSFDPVRNKFTRYINDDKRPGSLSDNKVFCLYKDAEGTFYVGTDNGLNIFNGKEDKFRHFTTDTANAKNLQDGSIWSVTGDAKGNIWVGTFRAGLYLFDKKKETFSNYRGSETGFDNVSEKSDKIRTLYFDHNGKLWVGTHNGGLFRFNTVEKKFENAYFNESGKPGTIGHDWIYSMVEDDSKRLWIATIDSGICIYNEKEDNFSRILANELNPNGLNNNSITTLYMDESGNIWVGTSGSGINIFFKNTLKFKHFRKNPATENTLIDNTIRCLYQDSRDLLWIGSKGGELTCYDKKTNTYTHYKDICAARNKTILSIYEDKNGILWLGSYGGGVSLFDPVSKKSHVIDNEEFLDFPLKNNTIVSIRPDRSGKLWIATFGGGIYCVDPYTLRSKEYNTASGLSHNRTNFVMQDLEGNMWVATQGGISVIDPVKEKVVRTYRSEDSSNAISSNSVYMIYQDPKGIIWVGTSSGLNRIDLGKNEIKQYFQKDGLANDNIYAIIPDSKGNLWLSTNKGITRFNPEQQNVNGSAFKNFEAIDGLQEGEFIQGAFFKNEKTGEMFFGGSDGYNAFFPDNISDNKHIPPVWISSYKRFGKEVELDTVIFNKKFIELSYQYNFFSFEFVSLDYTFPSRNLYSYKMDGVDEDWSIPSNVRYASYTNLEGGDYVFHVKASNNDGVWNEEGAVLYIRIIPPFYKTKTFYFACVLLALIGIWSFIRIRTRAIEQEKKVLEEKVAERTAELAQKNLDITSSIEYAKRIQEAILPELKEIRSHLPESFVLFKPKDIVSGDFYWFGTKKGKKIIAAVDCTGHGVPGAFMSMIGNNLLSQIIMENGIVEPDEILNELNKGVQAALKQGTHEVETRDGMDVALCVIDTETREVRFSGAYRPLLIVSDGKLEKIESDKFPIGGAQMAAERIFTRHTKHLKKGDTLYMFSDGYADQFGGERGKKFMVKRLNELLLSMYKLSPNIQLETLESHIQEWKGSHEQVDDILVIGVRL